MAITKVIPPTKKDCGFFLNSTLRLCEKDLASPGSNTASELVRSAITSNSSHTNSYKESTIKMAPIPIKKTIRPENKTRHQAGEKTS